MAPCKLLADRACEGLGPYSDECAEARAVVPSSPSGTWTEACSALVDKYVSLVRPGGHGKKVNACRELMILTCEFHGQRSWQCKQGREQVNHLGRMGKREACVGDLMLWELKQIAQQASPSAAEGISNP